MLQALSELKDQYGFSCPMGEQGLALTTTASDVSGTLVPDKVLMDLDIPADQDQDQASMLAEPLGERSLPSCPNSGMEESDAEDGHPVDVFLASQARAHQPVVRCCCGCKSTGSQLWSALWPWMRGRLRPPPFRTPKSRAQLLSKTWLL